MKSSMLKKLGLAATAIAAVAGPATAGDWNYGHGGLKDLRGTAVPVPAPAPVPVYAPKWYFRADVGVNFRSDPGISENGLEYGYDPVTGVPDTPSGETFALGGSNFTSFFMNKEFDTSATYSIGAGYYWSKHFRTDITLGITSEASVDMGGTYQYDQTTFDPIAGPAPTGEQINGEVQDRTTLQTGTLLFNAYYDFRNYGRFKPYIGAGLGLAFHGLRRRYSATETICTPDAITGECPPGPQPTRSSVRETSTSYGVAIAAAVTTGIVYDFNEYTALDLSYRYLYTGAADIGMHVNGDRTTVDIDSQHHHQIRAGLRWNIN